MTIDGIKNLISDYREQHLCTSFYDRQLANGYVSFREVGTENVFFVYSITYGYITFQSSPFRILARDPGEQMYTQLRGKVFERYTPFAIYEYGTIKFDGDADAVDILSQMRTAVMAAHDAQAEKPRLEGEPVRPAYTGGPRNFSFFTRNGIEYHIFTQKSFRSYNEARRFYRKTRLPYAENETKDTLYYMIVISVEDIVRFGGNLKSAILGAMSDFCRFSPEEFSMDEIAGMAGGYCL